MSADRIVSWCAVELPPAGAGPGPWWPVPAPERLAGAARGPEPPAAPEQVLGTLGVITGTAPAGRLAALAALEGVAGVTEQTRFQSPPPDADVQ